MLVFHSGDHSLQGGALSVANVSNLTLQGSTTSISSGAPVPRIVCESLSLSFSAVSDLHIVSINLVSCRNVLSLTVSVFQDCSFENSTAVNGGAMALYSGSNVTFLGLTVFTGNTATQKGGAIYADNSLVAISGKSTFTDNHSVSGGALYTDYNNNLSFSGNSSFEENTADIGGGVVYAWENNALRFSGNNAFEGNTAVIGGAVYAWENNALRFSGNNNFEGNTANLGDGALSALQNNIVCFSGNSSFERNTVRSTGGALYTSANNVLSFSGNNNFEGNTADTGGVWHAIMNNILTFSGNSSFEGNTADNSGGAFYANEKNILGFTGNSNFEGNTADFGGALYAYEKNNLGFTGNSNFEGNIADNSGGALYAFVDNTLSFSGNSNFEGNKASTTGGSLSYSSSIVVFAGGSSFSSNTALFGGAIYAVNSITNLTESCTVIGNSGTYGGGIFAQFGRITFQGAGNYIENSASPDGYGGAILAISSIVAFSGSYQFISNTAGFGGGVALVGIKDRTLLLEPGTNLSFNGNTAHKRGQALYVESNSFTYCIFDTTAEAGVRDGCFVQFFDPEQHVCDFSGHVFENTAWMPFNSSLNFDSNTAVESGDALYGGYLETCGVCLKDTIGNFRPFQGTTVFGQVTNVNMSSEFEISSDPYEVCVCENNQPNCNQTTLDVRVYPGHMLSLAIVSVGQMDGVAPSSVIRAVTENLVITSDFQVTQPTESNKSCIALQYPLLSKEMSATMKLYSEEPCSTSGIPLTVHITFLPCPVGFTLSDQGMCICEERLQKYTQRCEIQNLTVHREKDDTFWVGVEYTSKADGLILHPYCPFDYCTDEAVSFTLNRTHLQCSTGRSGVLCGGCQSGRSLALGSSRCLSGCSNESLSLLLAFAVAGVVLVAFLFLCHLTVAEGTVSGLIFYANFLAVNRNIFFPEGTTSILTVFIAWLNLDLGIGTCFLWA